jgi:adenine-specific DNA-methyltransferase
MPENIESLNNKIEELQKEVKKLKSSINKKKFGLVWMDIPEEFEEKAKKAIPVLKEVTEKAVINTDGKPTHILIQGENYHSLTCLNYTHKGKVDVIYIDPPYNTGAKDWKYNNHFVDENDPWRHSKWVAMMEKRLLLGKRLLKPNGVLIVAVDDNEVHRLRLLIEEIMPAYDITSVTIVHNPRGNITNNFARTHEYALYVIPKKCSVVERDRKDIAKPRKLRRWGHNSTRKARPTMFYPIYVKDGKIVRIGSVPEDYFHPTSKNIIKENGEIEVWPIDQDGIERRWNFSLDTIRDQLERMIAIKNKDMVDIFLTQEDTTPKTVWTDSDLEAGRNGATLVKSITGTDFPFPKSIYTLIKCLRLVIRKNPHAVVLDFFAGSGTTGHAVLELNREDDGQRQFILCTNNENNICEEVTYPRIERVINGYKFEGKDKEILYEKKLNLTSLKRIADILEEIEAIKIFEGKKYEKYEVKVEDNHVRLIGTKKIKGKKAGFGGSLKYYITDFIGENNVLNATDADKIELAHQAGDLLSIAENTLFKVEENDFWQLYENDERYTAVYFREELDLFEKFVSMIEKLDWPVTVYVFSWGEEEFIEEFEHIEKVKVKTIPLPILEIYKSIYNLG